MSSLPQSSLGGQAKLATYLERRHKGRIAPMEHLNRLNDSLVEAVRDLAVELDAPADKLALMSDLLGVIWRNDVGVE